MLHKGNLLSDYERQAAAKQIAMLTGLSEDFVLRNDLRIEATRFRVELMRDKQVVVGRLDSRVASKPPAERGRGNGGARQGPRQGRRTGGEGTARTAATAAAVAAIRARRCSRTSSRTR